MTCHPLHIPVKAQQPEVHETQRLLELVEKHRKREPFRVNIRFGHLDRMPKCKHGRVEGFCACFEEV